MKLLKMPMRLLSSGIDRLFNEAMIARLPKLKFLMFTGERNGTLEASALVSRNIPMACTPGGPSKETTAELTWALILGASKRLIEENKLIASGGWRDAMSVLPMLSGERLGIMGLGAIGSRVARGWRRIWHGSGSLESAHDSRTCGG